MRISRDAPCLYVTATAKDRLPIFRTDAIKRLACTALDEARRSGGFLILAYVIMLDHLHLITDGALKPSDVLRYIKGVPARRIIDYLKLSAYGGSLEKLRVSEKQRNYRYELWDHHTNVGFLPAENVFMQKVHYTHNNPVRLGLVDRPEDYLWSSARLWLRRPAEYEPLSVDIGQIEWRSAAGKA